MKKSLIIVAIFAWALAVPAQEPGSEARALYGRGLEAVGRATTRNELKAAARLLEQAQETAPGWAEIHFALGRVYQVLDVYDRAAEGYEGYLESAADAPDREEAMKHVRICRQKQKWLGEDKRLMASGIWAKVRHLPPVRFNHPMVSCRFRIDSKGRMFAQHPYLEVFDDPPKGSVKERWSPVTFDGKYFEYEYYIYFQASGPVRTEYMVETVRGEIIRGAPTQVRQEAWSRMSPTVYPYRTDLETLRGEVLHALR